MHHTDENLESPPFPFNLLKKVHISLAEGMAMDVTRSSDSREYYDEIPKGLWHPNNNAFEAEPLVNRWDMTQLRKKTTGSQATHENVDKELKFKP